MHRSLIAIPALLVLAVPAAMAQRYDFVLDPAGTAQLTMTVAGDLPGTIIGDYDPATNPGGTQTRPGLFGGSGNQPVVFDIDAVAGLDESSSPAGAFRLDLDEPGLSYQLDALAFDPLDGGVAAVDVTLTFLFDSFRSFAPDSVYFGGIPLPLPLDNVTIADLVFVQTDAVAGALVPRGMPGTYDLMAMVPAELSLTLDFDGTMTPVDPVPVILPLSAVLDLTGAEPQAALSVMQSTQQTIDDPLNGMPLPTVPIPLPTILPPGSVANVLYDGTLDTLDLTLDLDAMLSATGTRACDARVFCSSNPNSTGAVGTLAMTGSTSLAANDFGLLGASLPPARSGLFFYGTQAASQPFGDGVRCVGGTVVRGTLLQTTQQGEAARTLDLVSPSNPNGVVQPGETRYFQFWHRDQSGGGPSFTTSEGLEVTFCP